MNIFLYVAIAVLIALLSSRLMKKIKLPNVTGYLITGIIIGPCVLGLFFNGFDFIHSTQNTSTIYNIVSNLSWISTLALGFIAFTIGNNFQLYTIKQLGKRVVVITLLEAFGAALFVFGGLTAAHFIEGVFVEASKQVITWPLVLTLSAISCATAPAATLLVIKQYKAKGPVVKTLLPVVALDDAAALIMFSILFSLAKTIETGSSVEPVKMILGPLLEIILSLVIGMAVGFLITFLAKHFKSRANKFGLCLFGILLNIGLYYMFQTIHIPYFEHFELSSLLMCMMSSAVFVNVYKDPFPTLERIDQITPSIFMLFFVLSGAQLDLTIFASKQVLILLAIALIYLVFRVIGKCMGASSAATITKCEPTVRKYLGYTLIPQAGVAIGLATTAARTLSSGDSNLGSIIVACILTSTMIYELVGPVITKVALTKAGEIAQEVSTKVKRIKEKKSSKIVEAQPQVKTATLNSNTSENSGTNSN